MNTESLIYLLIKMLELPPVSNIQMQKYYVKAHRRIREEGNGSMPPLPSCGQVGPSFAGAKKREEGRKERTEEEQEEEEERKKRRGRKEKRKEGKGEKKEVERTEERKNGGKRLKY